MVVEQRFQHELPCRAVFDPTRRAADRGEDPEAAQDGDVAVQIEERALDDLLDGIDLAPTTAARKLVTH